MMLEDDLRATLRARAAEPAVQPDLLDEVRGGIRRSDRRRAAVLGAAAVLLTAIAVPVTINRSRSPEPVLPGAWQRPDLTPPSFPFTPGWLPAGLGAAEVEKLGPNVLLSYDTLTVEVGPETGGWDAEGEDRAATVRGRPATIRTVAADVYEGMRPGDQYVGIRWKLTDGRWVQLVSSGPATERDVVRFADDLRARPLPGSPSRFGIAAAPPGLVPQRLGPDQVCLAPPAAVTDREGSRGICLGTGTASEGDEPLEGEERVTVGGRAATLEQLSDGPELTVPLEAGRTFIVTVDLNDVAVTDAELIRFAEGVTVRP